MRLAESISTRQSLSPRPESRLLGSLSEFMRRKSVPVHKGNPVTGLSLPKKRREKKEGCYANVYSSAHRRVRWRQKRDWKILIDTSGCPGVWRRGLRRNRQNDRIRLNYVFHLPSAGKGGEGWKIHGETFGQTRLSVSTWVDADPPCFVPRETCRYAARGRGWKRASRWKKSDSFSLPGPQRVPADR